nr:PREDICTED: putative gustatory receptor 28b [Tribolium castaneum]|eukprot:XP_015833416.1 PREDICTED: putative gustatory receptor 28b [Tribolium castaneum]
MSITLVIMFALNIFKIPFSVLSFRYLFFSCYTATVFLVEALFLLDISSLIFQKFKSINQQIQGDIEEMENMSHSYCLLVDITNEIVTHFSMNLLVTFACWFGYFLVTMYFALCFISLKKIFVSTFTTFGVFLLYEIYWLFIVVNSFSQIQIEAEKIGSHVHEVWNKYTTQGKIDRRIRHLELLSFRFFYTKLELTVDGFFNLDWAFCHLIIAALATYSVIIIQFLM